MEHLDDISKRVCDTLGTFSNVRTSFMDISSQRHLIGIPKQPMTPVDNKPQSRLFPSVASTTTSGLVAGANGRVPAVCQESLNKVMQPNEMQSWRVQQQGVKTETMGVDGDNRLSANMTGTKDDAPFKTHHSASGSSAKPGGSNTKTTDKHKPSTTVGASKTGSRGHAKSRSSKSSAADAKSSESHSGPPNGTLVKVKKEFGAQQQPPQKNKSKKHEPDSRTEPDGMHRRVDSSDSFNPVPGKIPVRSLFDIDDFEGKQLKMKPLPKLDIPSLTVCIHLILIVLNNILI